MVNFPTSLDSLSNPGATTLRNDPGFELHTVISTLNDIAEALESKVGITDSPAHDAPLANTVLASLANGKTGYRQIVAGDVSPGSTMLKIAQTVLGSAAASISFTSIPATYEGLMLTVVGRSTQASTQVELRARVNNDTSGNYLFEESAAQGAAHAAAEGVGTTYVRLGYLPAASATANLAAMARLQIAGYARTVFYKALLAEAAEAHAFTTGSFVRSSMAGFWLNTAAINRIDVFASAGNLDTGTVATLYGLPA